MQWPLPQRRQALPAVPAFADVVVQLATFATGDMQSAIELARVALHRAPSLGYAITRLDALLPTSCHGWPSVESCASRNLDTPACDTECLVAALRAWTPHDRLLMGIWLGVDVPAEELEQWLPRPDAKARAMTLLRHAAQSLGWVEPINRPSTCVALMDALVEADDLQAERAIRLHILSCRSCEEERTALHYARSMIVRAWCLMLPASHFCGPTAAHTPAYQARVQRIMQLACALAVCSFIWFAATHITAGAPSPKIVPVPVTAQRVIERALHRWEQSSGSGIEHTRARVLSDAQTLVIERWYDWSSPHRLRVRVQTMAGERRLDLVTDGIHRLSYTVETPPFNGRSVSIDTPMVAHLLPLLRQLPVVGPLGTFPADLHNADLTLLWAAQQGMPRLLGTSLVHGRLVTHLLFTAAGQATVHLLIDQQTAAVLQAIRLDPRTSQSQTVWQADVPETLPSAAELFAAAAPSGDVLPDPRDLLTPPLPDLTVWTLLSRETPVAVPLALPDHPIRALLRDQHGPSFPIEQIYEGEDWSVVLNSSHLTMQHGPSPRFEQQIGDISYTITLMDPHAIVHVEWQMATIARGTLLFWHAGISRDRQVTEIRAILQSLTRLTPVNAPEIQRRFLVPETGSNGAGGQRGSSSVH